MAEKYKYKTVVREGVEYQVPVWIEPSTSREWFWVRWQQLGLPLPKYLPEVTITDTGEANAAIAFNGVKVEIKRTAA